MGSHLIDGHFQSDKYPWCKPDFVPLKVTDPDAQRRLWEYAQDHRARDEAFAEDLETALMGAGFEPDESDPILIVRETHTSAHTVLGAIPSLVEILEGLGDARVTLTVEGHDRDAVMAAHQRRLDEAVHADQEKRTMKTVTKKVADLIAAHEEPPLPLSVIPNHMGINLCSVDSVSWVEQDDGQLVSLTIHFIPAPTADA